MSIHRVAVIFDNTLRPETSGVYCRRALGQLVEVEHFLPTELARIPAGAFDLYLNVDDGLRYRLPPALRPSALWAIDTHMDLDWYVEKGRDFDAVFTAQRDGAAKLLQAGVKATARTLAPGQSRTQPIQSRRSAFMQTIGYTSGRPEQQSVVPWSLPRPRRPRHPRSREPLHSPTTSLPITGNHSRRTTSSACVLKHPILGAICRMTIANNADSDDERFVLAFYGIEPSPAAIPRYYQLEQRALEGLVEACEPRSLGRRQTAAGRVAELERELARLRRECDRQQALVRVVQRGVGLPPPPKPAVRPGGKPARKRQPVVRALRAAAVLRADCSGTEAIAAIGSPSAEG